VGAPLDRVGAQVGVEPGPLARLAEERQQRLGDGEKEEESIAPGRTADVRRAQPEAEAQIFASSGIRVARIEG
jgi:hypothetical protein